MRYAVKDFTESTTVDVSVSDVKNHGKMVHISQFAGGMLFGHSMRPDQARFMAAALGLAADEADGIVDEVRA